MSKRHRGTDAIARLRRGRSLRVRELMLREDLPLAEIAHATGARPATVDKVLAGILHSPGILAYLERRLGRPFRDLWYHYPESPEPAGRAAAGDNPAPPPERAAAE